MMNQLNILIFLLLQFMFFNVIIAQSPPNNVDLPSSNDVVSKFQPSLAVVIAILSTMMLCTFLLLMYAKYCHTGLSVVDNRSARIQDGVSRSRSRFSGISKNVVESLPFFRFSALKGARKGLECSVCLSKFEDIEILRLLPKCKHAFHIDCIDKWLEKHSSCPLCRHKISADDLLFLKDSSSLRFLWNQSELRDESNSELFIEREEENRHGSSRFRRFETGEKEKEFLIQQQSNDSDEDNKLHKLNHKIVISDVVLKNRWSNVSSSDLLFLNSEMVSDLSSYRFTSMDKISKQSSRITANEVGETSSSKIVHDIEKRSMSEITVHSRFTEFSTMKDIGKETFVPGNAIKEEKMRRIWLPIAKRTVEWFVNREKLSLENENTRKSSNV